MLTKVLKKENQSILWRRSKRQIAKAFKEEKEEHEHQYYLHTTSQSRRYILSWRHAWKIYRKRYGLFEDTWFCLCKRCCGHYTYAIIAYKSEDEILFVLDTNGSTKTLNRRHWSRCVRLVDTNHIHSYATTSYDRSSSSPHSSDTCKVKRAHDTPKPPPFATEKAIVWLFLGTLGELQFLLFQWLVK